MEISRTSIEDFFDKQGGSETLVTDPPKIDFDTIRERLMYITERGIELTLTFRPELHLNFTNKTLTQMVRNRLHKYTKRYCFEVCLIGEISPMGMYHMHGSLIAPYRMINSIRRNFPKEFGRTEIKAVKFVESYVNYILKKDENEYFKFINLPTTTYKELIPEETIHIQSSIVLKTKEPKKGF